MWLLLPYPDGVKNLSEHVLDVAAQPLADVGYRGVVFPHYTDRATCFCIRGFASVATATIADVDEGLGSVPERRFQFLAIRAPTNSAASGITDRGGS